MPISLSVNHCVYNSIVCKRCYCWSCDSGMTMNMLIWWQWMLSCCVNHVLWMWIYCLNRRLPFSPTINQWPTSLCQKAGKRVGQYHLLCTMNYQALFKSNQQWHSWTLSSMSQWCSQNRVVLCWGTGRATYMVLRNVRKVSVWKHTLLGGVWGITHQENRTSEIPSAGFSGQESVAKIIHISSI